MSTLAGITLAWIALAPEVGFEWDAPAQCPSEAEVERMVRERVGAPVRAESTARLDAIARVRATQDGRWALRLWVIDQDGTHRRDVEDADCRLLAETAATMVAMFVEPEAEAEREPEPEREPEAEPEPELKLEPEPEPEPRPTPRFPVSGHVRLFGHGGLEGLPRAAGGPGVAGGVAVGPLRVVLRGQGTFSAATSVDGGGSVQSRLWSGGVRAGYAWTWTWVELPVVAGVDGGALVARGSGLMRGRSGSVPWAAAAVSPAVVLRPVPRLGVWLGLEGFVTLVRPSVVLDDGNAVYRMGAGGLSASVGVGVLLGNVTDRGGRRQHRREAR